MENFTLDTKLLHNQRLWWLWQIWSVSVYTLPNTQVTGWYSFGLGHLCGMPACQDCHQGLILTNNIFSLLLLLICCYLLLLLIHTPLLEPSRLKPGAPLTVRPPLQVKRLFNVEEQLLCRVSEIEIEKEKAPASANLEAENFAAKRRSHHPGMRECFFDQWIFHSVWQHFHFQIHPAAWSCTFEKMFFRLRLHAIRLIIK